MSKLNGIAVAGLFIGTVALGYILGKDGRATQYAAGNGYPPSIVSKIPSLPRIYLTGDGDAPFFYIPEPDTALLSGLESGQSERRNTHLRPAGTT